MFSDNLPSQSDLDDVLVNMVDQAQIGDARQHARMLKMLRRHAKAGLWSTKENKTGFIKGSALVTTPATCSPLSSGHTSLNNNRTTCCAHLTMTTAGARVSYLSRMWSTLKMPVSRSKQPLQ